MQKTAVVSLILDPCLKVTEQNTRGLCAWKEKNFEWDSLQNANNLK